MAIKTEFLEGVETSARMYRGILTDLFTEGVKNVSAGHFRVVPRAAGANMTVTVLKGTDGNAVGYITGDDFTGQGLYRSESDADILDVAIGGAPASGSRTDLVVLETVDKTAVGGTVNETRVRVLPGQSALTAANKTMIPLASIAVAAGQVSVQTANITDLRAQAGAASLKVGTQGQPMTTAQRTALNGADLYDGRLVSDTTLNLLMHYVGGSWRPAGTIKAQGTYTGTGATGRAIPVGFAPDLVLVSNAGVGKMGWLHRTESNYFQSGQVGSNSYVGEYLSSTGFVVGSSSPGNADSLNFNGQSYAWTAFKFA